MVISYTVKIKLRYGSSSGKSAGKKYSSDNGEAKTARVAAFVAPYAVLLLCEEEEEEVGIGAGEEAGGR